VFVHQLIVLLLQDGHVLELSFDLVRDLHPGARSLVVHLVKVRVVNLLIVVLSFDRLNETLVLEVVVKCGNIALDGFKSTQPRLLSLFFQRFRCGITLPQNLDHLKFLLKAQLCVQLFRVDVVVAFFFIRNVVEFDHCVDEPLVDQFAFISDSAGFWLLLTVVSNELNSDRHLDTRMSKLELCNLILC